MDEISGCAVGAVRPLWHDRPVAVVILEADGEPLMGMNLLQGSRVTLDVQVDGDVTIDELPQ